MYTNADSLPNKKRELELLLEEHQPDIVVICEALHKNYSIKPTKQSLRINGFTPYINFEGERENMRGIYVHISNGLEADEAEMDSSFEEHLWFRINDQLLLGCIYRSPSSVAENSDLLCNLIHQTYSTCWRF